MELLIKFTDQSQSFTNGVEFGRLLEKMERGDHEVINNGFPVRLENKALIIDACKAYEYIPIFGKEYYGEWIEFMGVKKISLDN